MKVETFVFNLPISVSAECMAEIVDQLLEIAERRENLQLVSPVEIVFNNSDITLTLKFEKEKENAKDVFESCSSN